MTELLLFQSGKRKLGIELALIKNILKGESEAGDTRQRTKYEMRQIDGRTIPAVDLACILEDDPSDADLLNSKIIVVDAGDTVLALKVDHLFGRVLTVSDDSIFPLPPVLSRPLLTYFSSVLNQDNELVLLLNPEAIADMFSEKQNGTTESGSLKTTERA